MSKAKSEQSHMFSSHLLYGRLLSKNWARVVNEVQIDKIFQVVVSSKFRDLALSIAHYGVARYLGVKKTYDRVVCHSGLECSNIL